FSGGAYYIIDIVLFGVFSSLLVVLPTLLALSSFFITDGISSPNLNYLFIATYVKAYIS
ncbi:31280_t:CDS:2, partial [Racocetra persica]